MSCQVDQNNYSDCHEQIYARTLSDELELRGRRRTHILVGGFNGDTLSYFLVNGTHRLALVETVSKTESKILLTLGVITHFHWHRETLSTWTCDMRGMIFTLDLGTNPSNRNMLAEIWEKENNLLEEVRLKQLDPNDHG